MVEPNMDTLNRDYVRAWRAMPAIVAAYADGSADAIDVPSASSLIAEIVAEEIARSRQSEGDDLAAAKDLLEQTNPDLWDAVHAVVSDTAFAVGLALGVYAATNGGAR